MALSATERTIVRNVVTRLQGRNATPEIKAILEDDRFRVWLATWVIAPLKIVGDEEPNRRYRLKTALGLSK